MLVYKYRGGNKEIFERDLNSLEEDCFYSSSYDELNDPCETISNSERFIKQALPFYGALGANSFGEINFVNKNTKKVLSFDKSMGIYSLSKSYNDELLWAHYAEAHTGFCIEYDLNVLLNYNANNIETSFSVIYKNTPPNIGFLDVLSHANKGLLKKTSGFKSTRWKYESEYRIITNKFGKHHYAPEALKSIFFGIRMNEENKYKTILRFKEKNIKFYQMKQIESTYNFEAIELKLDFKNHDK